MLRFDGGAIGNDLEIGVGDREDHEVAAVLVGIVGGLLAPSGRTQVLHGGPIEELLGPVAASVFDTERTHNGWETRKIDVDALGSKIHLLSGLGYGRGDVGQQFVQALEPLGTGGARAQVAFDEAEVVLQPAVQSVVQGKRYDRAGGLTRGNAAQKRSLLCESGGDGDRRGRRRKLHLARGTLCSERRG